MDRARRPALTVDPVVHAGPPTSRRERRAQEAARVQGPQAVLAVCTGNICRSAFAEHALRGRLESLAPGRTETASAGTRPDLGLRVPSALSDAAESVGVHGLRDHRPSRVNVAMISAADLVLCATRDHMRQVLREVPRALGVTFTILELAALISRMDDRTDGDWFEEGQGLQAFARQAARHRSLARLEDVPLDIADPFGGPDEDYAEMVRQMTPALETIAGALALAVCPV